MLETTRFFVFTPVFLCLYTDIAHSLYRLIFTRVIKNKLTVNRKKNECFVKLFKQYSCRVAVFFPEKCYTIT